MFLLLSRYTGSVSTAQEHSINTGMNSMTRRQCKHVKGVLVLETGTALRSWSTVMILTCLLNIYYEPGTVINALQILSQSILKTVF